MPPNNALAWLSRTWMRMTQPPETSRRAIVPLLCGGILLVIFLLALQVQTSYLLQNSYSEQAKDITSVTTAPLWEESVKIGGGVLGGALFSGFVLLGLWIRQRRLGQPRLGLGRLWRRIWPWASVSVFWVVAMAFAVSESLGGGLNGRVATPLGFAFEILTHPAFAILALPLVLEAEPRAALFIGVGYGFHSMMNLVVNFLPESFFGNAIYLLGLLIIGYVDLWFLTRWYPPIRTFLRRFLPRLWK